MATCSAGVLTCSNLLQRSQCLPVLQARRRARQMRDTEMWARRRRQQQLQAQQRELEAARRCGGTAGSASTSLPELAWKKPDPAVLGVLVLAAWQHGGEAALLGA